MRPPVQSPHVLRTRTAVSQPHPEVALPRDPRFADARQRRETVTALAEVPAALVVPVVPVVPAQVPGGIRRRRREAVPCHPWLETRPPRRGVVPAHHKVGGRAALGFGREERAVRRREVD